jgi:flavodoxin
MKVALAVYTKTGNSAFVARAVAEKLRAKGHDADVQMLKITGDVYPGVKRVEFERVPSLAGCDALVLGGPVWAFRASPPLPAYVAGLGDTVKGKKAAVFVTHALPFMFTGPRRALRTLHEALSRRGATVVEGVAVRCGGKPNDARTGRAADLVVERLCGNG